jgi:ketosteroid isomerase-like protein
MSQDNAEIVRRNIDAFNQRDVDDIVRDWDPEIEADWSRSRGPEAGIYHGPAAVLDLWRTYFDVFDRVTVCPDQFIERGEYVVVPNHVHFRGRDRVRVQTQNALVATLRNGRIVEWCLFQERDEALEAAGASAPLPGNPL